MRKCLLLVSLLACAVLSAASLSSPEGEEKPPLGKVWKGLRQFSVTIEARGAEITGICIVKTLDDGSCRGSIVNEFGIHALDFIVTADCHRVKLHNVMPQLNRWYLKRILRKDLRILSPLLTSPFLRPAGSKRPQGVEWGEDIPPRGDDGGAGRVVVLESDGTITLTNPYRITYHFKPIDTQADDTEE